MTNYTKVYYTTAEGKKETMELVGIRFFYDFRDGKIYRFGLTKKSLKDHKAMECFVTDDEKIKAIFKKGYGEVTKIERSEEDFEGFAYFNPAYFEETFVVSSN